MDEKRSGMTQIYWPQFDLITSTDDECPICHVEGYWDRSFLECGRCHFKGRSRLERFIDWIHALIG